MALNAEHFCDATRLYTNGQAAISVVERNQTNVEVAYHSSLKYFAEFGSRSGIVIDPEAFHIVSNLDAAESLAKELLAKIERFPVQARKGDESAQVMLQPAGSVYGLGGYPVNTLIASFRGRSYRIQSGGIPTGFRELYRALNEFRPQGFVLMVCATCELFRFSGLTRDWSGGSSGYCARAIDVWGNYRLSDRVSVDHWCCEYSHMPDEQRTYPYIRSAG